MATTFDLLNSSVQKTIWEMGWQNFRPIQDEAIELITGADSDLIISAPTASGKTEAAFLPLISRHFEELREGVAILYISPLKALINDQFGRINELCREMDIPITRWHGDAEQKSKKRLLKRPQGILMITPESIEGLLVRREVEARRLFSGVKCLVIDEIHNFLAGERGLQLYSLLNRIEKSTGREHLRRVALSATLGRAEPVKEWLSPTPERVRVIEDRSEAGKEVYGNIFSFIKPPPLPAKELSEELLEKLSRLTSSGKSLVFSNSKSSLERCCDKIRRYTERKELPDIYRIHHGSLGKKLREETERELKSASNLTVFCTTTLELGIDIGDIDLVIFLAPPWSVSSFTQRIGRSGRKEGKALRFAFLYELPQVDNNSSEKEKLRVELVKSIAVTELYLEHFSEPCLQEETGYSCLVHQLLAYLTQRGGAKADELYRVIIRDSFREALPVDEYIALLRHLKELGYIEQFDSGELIPAAKGERLVENYKFYAVFKTPEQWSIISKGETIGEILFINYYKVDDRILLGGKRWIIESIEEREKRIYVTPCEGKSDTFYLSSISFTSREIHRKMRELYEAQWIPSYADRQTGELLEGAYSHYETLKLNPHALFHFEGGRIGNTINLLLKAAGIGKECFEIGMKLEFITPDALFSMLEEKRLTQEGFMKIASELPRANKLINKYDHLLPDNLLDRGYLETLYDVEGTIRYIKTLTG